MSDWKWSFEKQSRMRPSGINLAEPNFTRESKNIVRLFKREFNQNVIDARRDDPGAPGKKKPAHVRVAILDQAGGLDCSLLSEVFKPLEDHLVKAGHAPDQRDWKNPRVLILEEFQTVGLTGVTDDSYAKGEYERWANFWFGEGKRSKTGTNLGRQGQGKITYHIVSGARAVLALTRREGDDRELLFGKCIVQETHEVLGEHYTQHGYWPRLNPDGQQPIPETDSSVVTRIKNGFRLERDKTGTSWIIPFIPPNFTPDALLREFVSDFFFSILNEDLTADICGTTVNSGTVMRIVTNLKIAEPSQEFFSFLMDCITRPSQDFVTIKDGWEKGDRIAEDHLTEAELTKLREEFRAGKLVSVRFQVPVQLKGKAKIQSFIEVHLQTGDEIKSVEEIYVRSGLLIADEKWLKEQTNNSFGMVLASENAVAGFLAYCEVASHLSWNAREKEAIERYEGVQETLSCVRKSLPKLFRLLAGTSETLVEDALEDILSLPKPSGEKQRVIKKKVKPTKPRKPKPLEVFAHAERPGQWQLRPGPDAPKASYPLEVTFRFAYDRLDGTGNPWNRWHPYDFDLSASEFAPKQMKNIQILSRDGQDLKLKISREKFGVAVAGFSKEQPLLIQVTDYAK